MTDIPSITDLQGIANDALNAIEDTPIAKLIKKPLLTLLQSEEASLWETFDEARTHIQALILSITLNTNPADLLEIEMYSKHTEMARVEIVKHYETDIKEMKIEDALLGKSDPLHEHRIIQRATVYAVIGTWIEKFILEPIPAAINLEDWFRTRYKPEINTWSRAIMTMLPELPLPIAYDEDKEDYETWFEDTFQTYMGETLQAIHEQVKLLTPKQQSKAFKCSPIPSKLLQEAAEYRLRFKSETLANKLTITIAAWLNHFMLQPIANRETHKPLIDIIVMMKMLQTKKPKK